MSIHRFGILLFTSALLLNACGGGAGSRPTIDTPAPQPTPMPGPTINPSSFLNTPRFTTHQPKVLEQIGAHHAYARGLTGKGVRIGIQDTIVDYTQSEEFGNRVKLTNADGAVLAYPHPYGDDPGSDVDRCFKPTCNTWFGDSEGDPEAVNTWVRQIINENAWPTRQGGAFVLDENFEVNHPLERLYRWHEIPTPYPGAGWPGWHGTAVASTAAGKNLGVAPEATIIPIANDLFFDDHGEDRNLHNWIASLPALARNALDFSLAAGERDNYAKFEIINRSYGLSPFDPFAIRQLQNAKWLQRHLPHYLKAHWQTNTPDANKTILIYAAGNQSAHFPGFGAALPYYFQELRGHGLAVVATNPNTQEIATYSNACGPLPSNWDAARHGPHYCLTAPGTVRGLIPNPNSPGRGTIESGINGTSFAAPIVSGALALLMEHFRGTRGNTEVAK